jgi:hypothetical protein
MKAMTKLFALGALGAGAAYAGVRAKKRAAAKKQPMDAFDLSDLDEPVLVTEEVVIFTEPLAFEASQGAQNQNQQKSDQSSFEMPGRGSGPR